MEKIIKRHKRFFALFAVVAMLFSLARPEGYKQVTASETTDTEIATNNDAQQEPEEATQNDASAEFIQNEKVDESAKTLFVRVEESGASITVNAPAGSLPYPESELSLTTREIKEGTAEYEYYLSESVNALDCDSADSIAYARFFDIEILWNGEKVEPLSPVGVKIEYDDAPEISSDDELSIVHFAEDGTEVISDIDVNSDASEIVYEQESFSVTATVVVAPTEQHIELVDAGTENEHYELKDNNHDYILVATFNNKVFTVQPDGSLKEITAGNYTETDGKVTSVTDDAAFMWKYWSDDETRDFIRYASDGFEYSDEKIATVFAYTYIAPDQDSGILVATPYCKEYAEDDENAWKKEVIRENGVVKYDNSPYISTIVFSDGEIYSSTSNKYLTISNDGTHVAGKADSSDDGVKFYFAKPSVLKDEVDTWMTFYHQVNHIDISISDVIEADIPLAYGAYYDKDGKQVLLIDKDTYPDGYNLHVSQKVSVSQEHLRNAKITANVRNDDGTPGAELNDVFYVSGYSANAETNYSTPQVRIEGIFKVANIEPANQGLDSTLQARLENRILYTVEAVEPKAKFYYTHPNDDTILLYDSDGNPLYVEADVTVKASFDYFDSRNECPPLINDEVYGYYDSWVKGGIHPWGISGMDFQLDGESTVNLRPYAIEIENMVMDKDGNPIIPAEPITFTHSVYVNKNGDPDSVVGNNIDGYNGDAIDTTGYEKVHNKKTEIDNTKDGNGTGTVYDYSIPQGMVYVTEDASTIPATFVDVDGNTWEYSHTYIETEYVWRENDSNNGKRHFTDDFDDASDSYSSIPEVVGEYGTEFNKFLEFYVRNVYDKVIPPSKKEISPYEGKGTLGAVKVGDDITYEISYTNYKSVAADVVITDRLDPGVQLISTTNSGYEEDGVVKWTIQNVAAGGTGSVTLTVRVLNDALESKGGDGKVVNGGDDCTVKVGDGVAQKLNTVTNPVPENPVKREVNPYEGTGVLGAVNVGDEITYEITYKNYKDTAADITIIDTLDKNVEFVEASDDGKLVNGVVTWTLKNVAAGKAGTVTLKVKVLDGALIENNGPGKVVNGGDTSTVRVGADPEYTLNIVENPVPKIPAKREISPYEGMGKLGAVDIDDEIEYEIIFENDKDVPVDIIISDKLDDNVQFVEASEGGKCSNSSESGAGGTVKWTLKDYPAKTTGKVTVKVKVLEGAAKANGGPGKVVNGGKTTTIKVGDDPEQELDKIENPVNDPPAKPVPVDPEKKELAPFKGKGELGEVKVGDEITYEIDFTNYLFDSADIIITDILDKNVQFVMASDNGVYDKTTNTVTWMLEKYPAETEGKVTLTVKVLEGALVSNGGPGKVVNGGKDASGKNTAVVKIGDDEYGLDRIENPVKEEEKSDDEEELKPVDDEVDDKEPVDDTPETTDQTDDTPATDEEEEPKEELGNLVITVTEEKTNRVVPGAEVEVKYPDGKTSTYTTDEVGRITLKDIPVGDYTITIKKVPDGYNVSTDQVLIATVTAGATTEREFKIVTKTDTDTTVKTDDPTQTGMLVFVMILSVAGIIFLADRKRKNRNVQ